MLNSSQIHIAALDRMYRDDLVTDKEYKAIMDRIVSANIKDKGLKEEK